MNQASDGSRADRPAPAHAPLPRGRRRLLYGAVAGAALLAGAGLAWWKNGTRAITSDDAQALWPLSFEMSGRPTIRMQALAGKPLLLNFWATWCPPCVDELPLLDRFYRENSANGWQVVGLAADNQLAVDGFLKRIPIGFPVALAGTAGIELSRTLGNVGGGLPFTMVIASSGQVVQRKTGRVTADELTQWRLNT